MEKALNLLWLWGLGDSVWLMLCPQAWARFWGIWLGRIERNALLSNIMAAGQLGLCLYLLCRGTRAQQ